MDSFALIYNFHRFWSKYKVWVHEQEVKDLTCSVKLNSVKKPCFPLTRSSIISFRVPLLYEPWKTFWSSLIVHTAWEAVMNLKRYHTLDPGSSTIWTWKDQDHIRNILKFLLICFPFLKHQGLDNASNYLIFFWKDIRTFAFSLLIT